METIATTTKTVSPSVSGSLSTLPVLAVGQKVHIPHLCIIGEIECALSGNYYCVLTPRQWPGRFCFPRDLIAIRGEAA